MFPEPVNLNHGIVDVAIFVSLKGICKMYVLIAHKRATTPQGRKIARPDGLRSK